MHLPLHLNRNRFTTLNWMCVNVKRLLNFSCSSFTCFVSFYFRTQRHNYSDPPTDANANNNKKNRFESKCKRNSEHTFTVLDNVL